MTGYILRRVLRTLAVVIGISVVVFAFVRSIPGDPATVLLGERATPQAAAALREQLGLNKPWFLNFSGGNPLDAQYPKYVGQLLSGDLGSGIKSNIAVREELKQRFPATVELSIAAILFALLIGMPLGILAALRRNSAWDNTATVVSLLGVSMPVFWLGLLLSYFFAAKLGWLPPSARLSVGLDFQPVTGLYIIDGLLRGRPDISWDALRHLLLPAIALGTIPMAIIARITRSSLLDVLGQDYVRTAKAKGLAPRRVTIKHALRNALLPVVTVIGLQIGALLGGAVLTETIFSWPGLGSYVFDGINNRDYPVIQGGVIFAALIVSVVNLLVDLSYAALDPRIQYH
ncbi:ABC transporter permease [Deinococcus maricopensis]|uniref:ABC-type transporter, integral membrane subunit n=1 Tax=Deinococcus maricopensis (strain DSM 21211 / LMG 22137 / NRRL B-23946 / LB-34) TaxID=709986 RepID=E8UAG2_DEIML|nr:ABC transporter permease [Deinococcus maricopensis]ADV68051.1 ABC-type transporter, integral membrane subunit [Deinococcus maricopensis DSM 21211]